MSDDGSCPNYLGSVDAALQRVAELLPDHQVVTWSNVRGYDDMAEIRTGMPENRVFKGKGDTLPLAIIAALFEALGATPLSSETPNAG
jgi:hypothetical protein